MAKEKYMSGEGCINGTELWDLIKEPFSYDELTPIEKKKYDRELREHNRWKAEMREKGLDDDVQ